MVLEDVKNNKAIGFGLVSDINYIPFRDKSFDLTICNMVFEHFRRLRRFLQN
jgi:ubiquinone/menaquinone biosynthesis C-methylase UbiE